VVILPEGRVLVPNDPGSSASKIATTFGKDHYELGRGQAEAIAPVSRALVLREAAFDDIDTAEGWYEGKEPGLGGRFVDAVEHLDPRPSTGDVCPVATFETRKPRIRGLVERETGIEPATFSLGS
jgi:hypothetical protein